MKVRGYFGTINYHPDEDGWRNVDLDISGRGVWDRELEMAVAPDFVADIAALSDFRAETFDEIRAHHVLEHLSRDRAEQALSELHRVLVPGGTLDIEVPDVGRVCSAWARDEIDHPTLTQWLYGEQLPNHEPGDSHRYGWTEDLLRAALTVAGFSVGEREETGLALRFVARKPA